MLLGLNQRRVSMDQTYAVCPAVPARARTVVVERRRRSWLALLGIGGMQNKTTAPRKRKKTRKNKIIERTIPLLVCDLSDEIRLALTGLCQLRSRSVQLLFFGIRSSTSARRNLSFRLRLLSSLCCALIPPKPVPVYVFIEVPCPPHPPTSTASRHLGSATIRSWAMLTKRGVILSK